MTHAVLVVNRWVRYGHDRLYVKAADGAELGYRDNKTGVNKVAAGADSEAFAAALAAYWAGGGKPAPSSIAETTADPMRDAASPAEPGPAPAPAEIAVEEPERPWTDLSFVRPGSAARDQAVARRAEAPVKTFFARVLGVHTDERAWRIGADGEELVAAQLGRLGPDWKALHSIPVGSRGSDIDHLVIGPGGIYTVNSKNHPRASVWVGGNTVLVNGSRTDYVRNSRYEARRTADLLSARVGFPVHVTGLIAIVCDRDKFTLKEQPPGGEVHVLTRRKVADWLSKRGPVFSPEQVDAVFEVARRSTTWA